MNKSVISTDEAPRAIGPYSQAICAGGMIFLSGQIALDPATGTFNDSEDVAQQAERVLRNLAAVLKAADCSPRDVVKTTIYLVDMHDFAAVNDVYGRFFEAPHPARATVQVAGLPRGAKVEIEAVAVPSRHE